MRKTRLLLFCMVVAIVIVVAGCSDTSDQSSDNASSNRGKPASKEDKQKPKTVVVNKGMSKKEEKKLNKRLDKLEKKVRAQDKKGSQGTGGQPTKSGQPEQSQSPQAEEQARAAAEAYYQAVAARNWDYTYNHLDSQTQSAYTEQEWAAKNEYLANTGAVTYTIQSVVMDSSAPETLADVTVVLTATDGSTNVRNTYFVYEDGAWLHRFSPEEYDLWARPQQRQLQRPPARRLAVLPRPQAHQPPLQIHRPSPPLTAMTTPTAITTLRDARRWETLDRRVAAEVGVRKARTGSVSTDQATEIATAVRVSSLPTRVTGEGPV
jgi:outer membrane murein-binding lipoprotein Lpp